MASSQQGWWAKTRIGGKAGFDKIYTLVDKLGAPVNKLTNKLGSEAFWPTTLDKESDKAARILRSFCKDGFYQEEKVAETDGPTAKQRVLKTIPAEVIQNAKGLAIFTTMRSGLWFSGAGGSGILVGRMADGSWSPPSGILLHTAGLGFLVGVDIYDCVVVINTQKALDAFSSIRCTLGGEISAVAGPVGAGGILETELHKRQAPVLTYLKSRGFYAGVQVDGTVIIERTDENERFYNEKISVGDILAGKVRQPPLEVRRLLETIKAAQGDQNVDQSMLPTEPPPGDYEIEASNHMFGVPDKEDPDPYGVLALEKEGMSIREAGTHKRASWEQFSFSPAPSSPIYSTYSQKSLENRPSRGSARSSWQTPAQSSNSDVAVGATSVQQKPPTTRTMTDMSTQTDDLPSSDRSSVRSSVPSRRRSSMNEIPEDSTTRASPRPASHRKTGSHSSNGHRSHRSTSNSNSPPPQQLEKPVLPPREEKAVPSTDEKATEESDTLDDSFDGDEEDAIDDAEDDADIIIEEPIVHSFQQAKTPQFISRARLVEVPKRVAPVLPPRNPNRARGPMIINAESSSEVGAERDNENDSASSPPQSPDSPTKTATSPMSSRPDWGRSSSSKDDGLTEQFEEVDISPSEKRNPWGSIIAKHNGSTESVDMPGAFHSLPPTPDERK